VSETDTWRERERGREGEREGEKHKCIKTETERHNTGRQIDGWTNMGSDRQTYHNAKTQTDRERRNRKTE
jgi:hypothetical protein